MHAWCKDKCISSFNLPPANLHFPPPQPEASGQCILTPKVSLNFRVGACPPRLNNTTPKTLLVVAKMGASTHTCQHLPLFVCCLRCRAPLWLLVGSSVGLRSASGTRAGILRGRHGRDRVWGSFQGRQSEGCWALVRLLLGSSAGLWSVVVTKQSKCTHVSLFKQHPFFKIAMSRILRKNCSMHPLNNY